MSWARIDDGLWHHDKITALREARDHAALALFGLAISYCGMKKAPSLTVSEASMLLMCGEADAARACDVLQSKGLFDEGSASSLLGKQYVVHDWKEYRSKNEAKAFAGSKGGRKSGETRRSKREAAPKQVDASASKQTRTPDPVPGPDPVPDPVPSGEEKITDGAALGNELRKHGVRLAIGAESAFGKYLPCTPAQVAEAARVAVERTGEPKAAYTLSVLDGLRRKPAQSTAQPRTAQAQVSGTAALHRTLSAIGKRHGVYGLGGAEVQTIRDLGATPEAVEAACKAADEASPTVGATWGQVIDRLSAPGAIAC